MKTGLQKPLFVLLAFASAAASAKPQFTIEITDVFGEMSFYNGNGDIVIDSTGNTAVGPVVWNGKSTASAAYNKMNSRGDGFLNAVQSIRNVEWPQYRAHLHVNGVSYTVEPFDGDSSYAYDLNNHGEVVGSADNGSDREPYIFKNGTVYRLHDLIDGPIRFTYPLCINDDGVIYGMRSVNGLSSVFVKLTPANNGRYAAVELATLPANTIYPSKDGRAVFRGGYWANDRLLPIGDLGVPERTYPKGVNTSGQAVGIAMTPSDESYHGFYWDQQLYDLNSILDLPAGWTLAEAAAINDYGQIAARAYTGETHKTLRLTPLPKIISLQTHDNLLDIQFKSGGPATVSLQASIDLHEWIEVRAFAAPKPTETASVPVSEPHGFYRIVRAP